MIDVSALYTEYAGPIRGWFWKRLPLGDDGLADELTATVFEKVVRYADRDLVIEKPSSWLFRIATTTLLDHTEKKRPVVGLPDLDAHRVTVDAGGDAHLTQLDVRALLSRLSEPYRAVIDARYLQGMEWREIAQSLGLSKTGVSERHIRALRALRGLVDGTISTIPWNCQGCGQSDRPKHSQQFCTPCYHRAWYQRKRSLSEAAS